MNSTRNPRSAFYIFFLSVGIIFLLRSFNYIFPNKESNLCGEVPAINIEEFDELTISTEYEQGEYLGRMLRGKRSVDFESMSFMKERRLVFLVGKDGLKEMYKSKLPDILVNLGYGKNFVKHLTEEEISFKLFVFKSKTNDNYIATWDVLLDQVGKEYPELKMKMEKFRVGIKSTPFKDIQKMAEYDLVEVAKDTKHDFFMTSEKLSNLSFDEVGLVDVRAFLYHEIGMNEFFIGNGLIHNGKMIEGNKEFIARNQKLEEFCGVGCGGCFLVDFGTL